MNFFRRIFGQKKDEESRISRALKVALTSDPSARHNLYDALARQRLILPVPAIPDNIQRDEYGRLKQDLPVNFMSFKDQSGRKFLAIFTDPEALKRWEADAPTWIAVDTPSLCRLALQSGQSAIRINPGSQDFVELSLDEIRMLAGRCAG